MLTVKAVVIGSSMQKILPASSIVSFVRCNSDVTFLRDLSPSSMKAGKGGRSSFSGKVVTIFGAGGFLGQRVTSHLAKIGTQIVVPYRDFFQTKRLKTMGDLGQLVYTQFSLHHEDSIRKAMLYSDCVINLIARNHDEVKDGMAKVNVDGARKIARIAREMGVPYFIHVSALNSNFKQEGFWNKEGSEFYRTKGLGEIAVKEEFPSATIFRPSDIFGEGDSFQTSLLCNTRVIFRRRLYIPNAGFGIYKQPVSVFNVAQGIAYAVMNPQICEGVTYEAIGKRRYEFHDLFDYMLRVVRKDALYDYKIGDAKRSYVLKLKLMFNENAIIEIFPKRLCNTDRIEREAVSDTTSGLPTLKSMNIDFINIESMAEHNLKLFRDNRHRDSSFEAHVEQPAKFVEPAQ